MSIGLTFLHAYITIIKNEKGINEMENNIIMLEDENGCLVEFEPLRVFEFEEAIYMALIEILPDEQENDEVLIMQIENPESEEPDLVMVDDEARMEAAFNEFVRLEELDEE